MNKTAERIESEENTMNFWLRIYQRDPASAFQVLAEKVLALEWELLVSQRKADEQ